MQHHLEPFLDERLVRHAIERSLGAALARLRHVQTKSRRSVYEAGFDDGRAIILKADDGSEGENFRLGLEGWAMEQAHAIGMPVPALLGQDLTMSALPFRYLLMTKAGGIQADSAALPPELRRSALRASGRWLARLHRIEVDGYGSLDEQRFLDSGTVGGSFARWAVPSTLRAEAALNLLYSDGMLDVEEAAGAMYLIEKQAALDEPPARLLHADFSARHTLVDPATGAITAIIDFGDRMGGDPIWDLSAAWLRNANQREPVEGVTEALIEGYEAETGIETPSRTFAAYSLIHLLILARSLYEQRRLTEILPQRMRLDLLLEDAGLL